MKRTTLHLFAATALLGLAAPTVRADTVDPDNAGTHEIRVVNYHTSAVRVYVEDADGKLRSLGRVARSQFKVLELSDDIARKGDVRLKFFPAEPLGSLVDDSEGIRTKDLSLGDDDSVNVVLETDLRDSHIEISKG